MKNKQCLYFIHGNKEKNYVYMSYMKMKNKQLIFMCYTWK